MPLGAFAVRVGSAETSGLELVAFVASPAGDAFVEARGQGADPVALGRQVAGALQAQGKAALR